MRLDRSRRSQNIEDRRGRRPSRGLIGGGIGTVILIIVAALFGIDPGSIDVSAPVQETPVETDTMAFDENRDFVAAVLGETEDVWNEKFAERGWAYQEPTLVLFSDAVESACGFAQSAVGPFYCPPDQNVYLDLTFFNDLANRFEAPGDFARAYVIAHEVGHHVQQLLGISDQVQSYRRQVSQEEANALSVLQELQADCLAGVWANATRESQYILEPGDIQEGLNAASAVGDDRIQQQTQGYIVPESFTHGSSQQRMEWFTRGLETGDIDQCDTFAALR